MAKESTRTNYDIKAHEVRLVSCEGEQLGIKPLQAALALADESGLDLVEIAASATPPVCRIMDYGKFRYEQEKKQQEARKKQARTELKELKLRPSTDAHDLVTKARHAKRFLEQGNRIKVTVQFRGREITHKELGAAALTQFCEGFADCATIEVAQKHEGRTIFVILAPKQKAAAA